VTFPKTNTQTGRYGCFTPPEKCSNLLSLLLNFLLYSAFFIVAFLYGSVGLGGATGYLAVLALFGITAAYIAPAALTLNLSVAGLSFWHFFKAGHFQARYFVPFVAISIPAAFLGGLLPVGENLFRFVLAAVLGSAGLRMLLFPTADPENPRFSSGPLYWSFSLAIGLVIGFLSGITGTGGGFILIPVLIFIFKLPTHTASASAAGFVFINSVGGLSGHLVRGNFNLTFTLPFLLVTIAGGFFGSRYGSRRWSPQLVQRTIGAIEVLGCIRLILG